MGAIRAVIEEDEPVNTDTPSDYFLDISKEVCPLTLVRAKLFLEAIGPGVQAVIRLPDGEPVQSLPTALTELGHTVLELAPESSAGESDPRAQIYRLHVQTAD